jgi:hypothetical protein
MRLSFDRKLDFPESKEAGSLATMASVSDPSGIAAQILSNISGTHYIAFIGVFGSHLELSKLCVEVIYMGLILSTIKLIHNPM